MSNNWHDEQARDAARQYRKLGTEQPMPPKPTPAPTPAPKEENK